MSCAVLGVHQFLYYMASLTLCAAVHCVTHEFLIKTAALSISALSRAVTSGAFRS